MNYGKVFRGALIAAGGAVLTYLAAWLVGADFGQWTPVAVAVGSSLVNAAREWLKARGDANEIEDGHVN